MAITVYTLPNCIQCNQTKKVLDKLELKYDVVDASTNEEAYNFITQELGYKAAPVVVVRDENGKVSDHWSGFNPEQISELGT